MSMSKDSYTYNRKTFEDAVSFFKDFFFFLHFKRLGISDFV